MYPVIIWRRFEKSFLGITFIMAICEIISAYLSKGSVDISYFLFASLNGLLSHLTIVDGFKVHDALVKYFKWKAT